MLDSGLLNEHSIPAIIAVAFCILLYLDARMNTLERKGRDYVKAFIVIYILTYLAIYMYNSAFNSKSMKGGGSENLSTNASIQGGGGVYYGSVGSNAMRENIFVGAPTF